MAKAALPEELNASFTLQQLEKALGDDYDEEVQVWLCSPSHSWTKWLTKEAIRLFSH
jgi:hypothetical protein